MILFDIVTIVLINSAYLNTKTNSTRCDMEQGTTFLDKCKHVINPLEVPSFMGNQK